MVASTLAIEQVFATLPGAHFLGLVDALSDVCALGIQRDDDSTGVAVETEFRVVISDAIDGLARQTRNIDIRLGGDLTRNHTQPSGEQGLTCDTAVGVLRQDCVKDCV